MAKENEVQQVEQMALTFDQVMQMQGISDEVDALNETKFCGVVTRIDSLPESEKKDKNGNPIIDEETGQPMFNDRMYWVSIGTTGDEDGCVLSAEQLNDVEIGKKFVFIGFRKKRKFRVQKIYTKQSYVDAIARKRFGL